MKQNKLFSCIGRISVYEASAWESQYLFTCGYMSNTNTSHKASFFIYGAINYQRNQPLIYEHKQVSNSHRINSYLLIDEVCETFSDQSCYNCTNLNDF